MSHTNEIIKGLTAKGLETMTAVGNWDGSFFDGGLAEGEGIWGECFMNEMGHKSTGVINRLRDIGLFGTTDDDEFGTWYYLTALGVEVAKALSEGDVEQTVEAALRADEPVAAEFTVDATKDWRGNYNTVFAPGAEVLAASTTLQVRTMTVSTMLKQTQIAGDEADQFLIMLTEIEEQALAAMKTWQKNLDRKDATDMEKYNQNRSFLSGYLAAAARALTGAKKLPVVAFAKDMDKALRPDALKAGAAARKGAS